MALVSKVNITETEGGLSVRFPPQRNTPVLIFMAVWLSGWLSVGVHDVATAFTHPERMTLFGWKNLTTLASWLFGLCFAGFNFCWKRLRFRASVG